MEKSLEELQPEIMEGFDNFAGLVRTDSGLDRKYMEMMVIAIAITRRCMPCIETHVKRFKDAGGSLEELSSVGTCCILMNGGPGEAYTRKALKVYQNL